jgi:hypothetical protein
MAASPRATVDALTSHLLRLYPRVWRARYEDELVALLADTALTPSIALDIVLAALDAHVSGDYPSEASDGRKVRRPVTDRLAPLTIVLGSAYMTIVAAVTLVNGATEGPGDDPLTTTLFYGLPFAIVVLALGIGGFALGRPANDQLARGLGLLTSALGLAFAAAIFYLFFVGDIGWAVVQLVIPAFALSSGLLGLRLLTADPDARLKGGLLVGGLVAVGAWGVAWYMTQSSARVTVEETAALIQLLGLGLLFAGWLAVGLMELRGRASVSVDPSPAT